MRSPDGKYIGGVGTIFCASGRIECSVIVDDLPIRTKTAKQKVQGGTMITGTLKGVIETGKPTLGIYALYVLITVLTPVITPKKSCSEHWPVDRAGF